MKSAVKRPSDIYFDQLCWIKPTGMYVVACSFLVQYWLMELYALIEASLGLHLHNFKEHFKF